jgi:hypothetical protein
VVPRISVQTSRKKGSKPLDVYRDTSVSRCEPVFLYNM